MFLDQGQSWRQGSRPQPVDQAQDLSEQRSWYDGFWLQADIQSPEIEVCFTPKTGHSSADVGFGADLVWSLIL